MFLFSTKSKKVKFYCNYKQDFIVRSGAGRFLDYIVSFFGKYKVEQAEDFREADTLLLAVKFDQIDEVRKDQKVVARFDALDVNFLEGTEKLFERADKLIFQTKHGLKLYERFFGKISKPYTIILNGAPLSPVRRKLSPTPVMISVGTWADIPPYKPYYNGSPKATDVTKCILYFPKVLEKIDLEWWIVGEYLSQEVLDISKKYPKLRLLGRLDKKELFEVYKKADFLFHPGQNDNCPNVVVESLVASMPVIYYNSGGVPELVEDAGIGIKSNDLKEFEKAIVKMILGYSKYVSLAKQRGKEIDIKLIQKKYWDFILS